MYFTPDTWRLARANELWDRILLRSVVAGRRMQTAGEFDAQLAATLGGVQATLWRIRDLRNGPPTNSGAEAEIIEAEEMIANIGALSPPTRVWADVCERLVAMLKEDLEVAKAGKPPDRSVDDAALRELQRSWAQARRT